VLTTLKKLSRVSWRYQRHSTTAAVATVAVISSLAARAMLPRTPPAGAGSLLAATVGAYAVIRLGSASGLSKRFKHHWMDRFGGDVDDAQTWLLGTLGGIGTLVVLRAVRETVGRRLAPLARRESLQHDLVSGTSEGRQGIRADRWTLPQRREV
jgi:hypothetical protein